MRGNSRDKSVANGDRVACGCYEVGKNMPEPSRLVFNKGKTAVAETTILERVPSPRPLPMPPQEIVAWTPSLLARALWRGVLQGMRITARSSDALPRT